jgi:hypothetical protein
VQVSMDHSDRREVTDEVSVKDAFRQSTINAKRYTRCQYPQLAPQWS